MKSIGYFGLFDILGYSRMNEGNNLDSLIDIFTRNIVGVDQSAVTLAGAARQQQLFSFAEVKTILFSDMIIFYEESPKPELVGKGIIDPSQFMLKACTLLRLAFEGGIPLRGAISFGEYYVHERTFLGKPIIEARNFEVNQEWSGAALCKSAEDEYLRRLQIFQEKHVAPLISNGSRENVNPILPHNFVTMDCLYKYPIPCKESDREGLALCWDDSVYIMSKLRDIRPGIERLNLKYKKQINKRIEEKFSAHRKPLDKKVKRMIKNTTDFIFKVKDRF
ncbi:MAG: hypothetical protein WB392_12045 [Methanotrichaceae archaeon]